MPCASDQQRHPAHLGIDGGPVPPAAVLEELLAMIGGDDDALERTRFAQERREPLAGVTDLVGVGGAHPSRGSGVDGLAGRRGRQRLTALRFTVRIVRIHQVQVEEEVALRETTRAPAARARAPSRRRASRRDRAPTAPGRARTRTRSRSRGSPCSWPRCRRCRSRARRSRTRWSSRPGASAISVPSGRASSVGGRPVSIEAIAGNVQLAGL